MPIISRFFGIVIAMYWSRSSRWSEDMILHVLKAKYLRDYVIWVRFNDGAKGAVDLAGELDGEMFEPLKKPVLFKAFRVDPVLRTLVWPNEADLAPEFLYGKLRTQDSLAGAVLAGRALASVREKPVEYRRRGRRRQVKQNRVKNSRSSRPRD